MRNRPVQVKRRLQYDDDDEDLPVTWIPGTPDVASSRRSIDEGGPAMGFVTPPRTETQCFFHVRQVLLQHLFHRCGFYLPGEVVSTDRREYAQTPIPSQDVVGTICGEPLTQLD